MFFARVAALTFSAAALTAGVVGTPTASADTVTSTAFALSASGLLQIEPIPNVSDAHGFFQDAVVDFSTPNRAVRARVLNAQAGTGHAKASVADLTVDLSPVKGLDIGAVMLSATVIEATCDHGVASSSLAGARLGNQVLDVSAPANTTVRVAGLASVVLNKHTLHEDGSVTVTAISISLTGVQTLNIASATCRASNNDGNGDSPPPPTPTTMPTTPNDDTTDDIVADRDPSLRQAPRPTPVAGHLDVTG